MKKETLLEKEDLKDSIKALESETEACVVLTADGFQMVAGEGRMILTLITSVLQEMYKKGCPEEAIKKVSELALKDNEEIKGMAMSKIDELIEKIEGMLSK